MNKRPGIFNDVIGPVMRGPSSSHTAASWRISLLSMGILNEALKKALIEFDKDGIWASNYREQGSVMGIDGGLLGLEITDPRMKDTAKITNERGLSITYEINSFPTTHPNTVRLSLEGISGNKIQILAVSLGGGSIEIQQIDGFNVSIRGDYFELLILNKNKQNISEDIQDIISQDESLFLSKKETDDLINIKSPREIPADIITQLKKLNPLNEIIILKPILPIVSGKETELPFSSIESLIDYAEDRNLDLGDIGLIYEQCMSGDTKGSLFAEMKNIVSLIENSIKTGLEGTTYEDRILHQQSHLIGDAEKKGRIPQHLVVNKIIANVTAIMESKSAMEVIVANPTAGSCGTIGGLLKALADDLHSSTEEIAKAYFAAGVVGAYFAAGPGFSAEEHGCQVECGAASGMAAAALSQLHGGTAKQAINAASMAIQNMIGLVCDPVADRVEVPCLGKNISAAMNALSSASMACAGYDAVIPLEEVIQTISKVSKQMPSCVKCTGKGGLSISPTSLSLKKDLKNN